MQTRVRNGVAIAALVVVTTLGATIGAGLPAAADPAVTVTVTPSTGLLQGHVVQVSVTGLEPGVSYWVAQCPITGTCTVFQDVGGRPFIPPTSSLGDASPDGAISVRLQLNRDMCDPDGCVVKAIPNEGPEPEVAGMSEPLDFAPTGTYQWPQASLSVTFPNPVVEGATAGVAVTGMSPWFTISPIGPSVASIDICRDDGELDGAPCVRGVDWSADRIDGIALGSGGGGSAGYRLRRHLPGGWDWAVDGCVLVVTQGGTDEVVGNPRTQAVPITYAPEWAPFPSASSFVDRAVAGVLGRPPTSAGRARLLAGLPDRSITGVQALVEAAASSKLDADVGEVVRLYRAYLGRPVETKGLGYWVGRVRAGTTPLQLGRTFAATPEFRARYGSLGSGDAVRLTYQTVLGRAPGPQELSYWSGRLDAGLPVGDMVYSFARSPENRSRTNRAVWSTIVLWRLTGFAPNAEQLAGGPERAAADALAGSHP